MRSAPKRFAPGERRWGPGSPGGGPRALRLLVVRPAATERTRGLLQAGPLLLPCALGRGGVSARKREGDGATPLGALRLLRAMWPAGLATGTPPRLSRRPRTGLALRPIRAGDGWCDAAGDRNYNRPVRLPYPASCETMLRADNLYRLVVDLDWNRSRRAAGRGSAIFLHVASPRPGGNGQPRRGAFAPTEGCVALPEPELRRLLVRVGPRTSLLVLPRGGTGPRRRPG